MVVGKRQMTRGRCSNRRAMLSTKIEFDGVHLKTKNVSFWKIRGRMTLPSPRKGWESLISRCLLRAPMLLVLLTTPRNPSNVSPQPDSEVSVASKDVRSLPEVPPADIWFHTQAALVPNSSAVASGTVVVRDVWKNNKEWVDGQVLTYQDLSGVASSPFSTSTIR